MLISWRVSDSSESRRASVQYLEEFVRETWTVLFGCFSLSLSFREGSCYGDLPWRITWINYHKRFGFAAIGFKNSCF